LSNLKIPADELHIRNEVVICDEGYDLESDQGYLMDVGVYDQIEAAN
jgi:hypothetical protein